MPRFTPKQFKHLAGTLARLARESMPSGKTWPAWAMLAVGLLLSIFAGFQVKQGVEADAVRQFAFTCDQVALKLQERLSAYALILRGGTALFAASVSVERQEWHTYVETLRAARSIPGVQGIGFALLIPPQQLARHIAAIRAEGFPEYTVRPPGERAVYTSIIYLEPFRDRNLRAFGFDMFSEPVRRAAMERARDTGEAALSGKVELVQETATDVQAGTLMYVPVYRNGAALATLEQRRAALIGWAYSPYRMKDMMLGILRNWENFDSKIADLHIYDGSLVTPASLLFDSQPGRAQDPHSLFNQTRKIDFNGHSWLLAFDQSATSVGISYAPAWTALIGGFALSGLLFGLMLSVINTRTNALCIAALLTEKIREHTEQLDAVFTLSPDGFITFDATRHIKAISPAITTMTGLDVAELSGLDETGFSERLASACLPEARFCGVAALRARLQLGASTNSTTDTVGKHAAGVGSMRRQLIEIEGPGKRVLEVGLRISRAETVSQILYFRDITHETEVDRLKSEFLSTAAHELRTPMASIFGFTELLMTKKFEETDRNDFLGTIYRQSELMISVINELLDLARIEARRGKDFTLARVDVRLLMHEIVTGFKTPQDRPSPQEPPANGPLWVRADRQKLTQAVSNVLSNAYKYSPGGGAVTIELSEASGDNVTPPRIGIHIADQGIGMTPEQLARVCERFFRADTSGNIPGTGLGMSIVKEIVELHGGEVHIDSEIGKGTTVTLWLPGETRKFLT